MVNLTGWPGERVSVARRTSRGARAGKLRQDDGVLLTDLEPRVGWFPAAHLQYYMTATRYSSHVRSCAGIQFGCLAQPNLLSPHTNTSYATAKRKYTSRKLHRGVVRDVDKACWRALSHETSYSEVDSSFNTIFFALLGTLPTAQL